MDEIFSAPDKWYKDMWWKISEGVNRRGKQRHKLFDEARKMLKEYTERRDAQVLDWEFGTERALEKVRELRAENAELKNDNEKMEVENDILRDELTEARSLYNHLAERYDESDLTGFLNLKEKDEPACTI